MSTVSNADVFGWKAEPRRVRFALSKACLVSILLHASLLFVLGLITITQKLDVMATISSVMDNEQSLEEPLDPQFDTKLDQPIGNESEFSSFAASEMATTVLTKDPQSEMERAVDPTLDVRAPILVERLAPTKIDVLSAVSTTGTTEKTGGVEGAVDRLAWEIANSLREKKTLVVWMFDVSPSLNARREAIAQRVENVYNQLNELNVGADKALLSAVAVFGESCTIVTSKPLDSAEDLVAAVRRIKPDSSGEENTFGAVLKVAQHFLPFRTEQHRDVMLIVVTDEEGSDLDNLEKAIDRCKKYGLRCYCVGDSAPFGRKNVEVPFELDSGERVIGVMQKGPESRYGELLRLGYWATHGHDFDDMSSGFGPYGLTRLCTETNGLYFITDEGRGSHRFDLDVMRNYSPDYLPIVALDREIQRNKAKLALMQACTEVEREAQRRKVLNISMPRLEFKSDNDTVLRRELTEAQKPIADLDASLDLLVRHLEQGEKDRQKIKEARWQASYDLAMGRTLALRVRAFGYNSMLAEMKGNPKTFQNPDNNMWRLTPSNDITTGVAVKKMAAKAESYLNRVIELHPNTPWALMAQREKSVPMGWDWKESHYNPNPTMAAGQQKPGPKFLDMEDNKSKVKPKKVEPAEPERRAI